MPRPTLLAALIAAAFTHPALAEDDNSKNPIEALEAPTVEVIGTTPLPTLGIPKDRVPGNVQGATSKQIEEQRPLNLADFLNQNIGNVSINEIGTNPYQPDVNFRGFTASPLLGTPQGLSVFQDGVRVNEPFGDIVNWDLIPEGAISSMNVIPGSNPLYGLNTLGGALAIRTKSGRQYPGFGAEAYAGSFGRKAAELQYGGQSGDVDYFVSGHYFEEDGWRDFSPSEVKQIFAKVGWETASTDFDLSLTHANNDLIGNELVPLGFYNQRREAIFTQPDQSINKMTMINLTGSHFVNDNLQIAGNVYHRISDRAGLNGDSNDDFEGSPSDGDCDVADFTDAQDIADCNAHGGAGVNDDTAAINRTNTEQKGSGFALQMSLVSDEHQFTAGISHDRSSSEFEQSTQEGIFNSNRGVNSSEPIEEENALTGKTTTWALYATDTYTLTSGTHITLSGRFNRTRVQSVDLLDRTPPNLDGDFTYSRFNPAIGITHRIFDDAMTAYGSWSQGNRAPSPIELGCADPANPCTLPNALASDPYLKQVVARTFEAGLRGGGGKDVSWNLGLFRTENKDDIIFVSTSAAAGYFTNFGKTLREGAEAGVSGKFGDVAVDFTYGFVRATYEDSACLLAENNSSRGGGGCGSDQIRVNPGDRIPGVPEHSLKLGINWNVMENWSVGLTGLYFSKQYVRGNENNEHQVGTFNNRTFEGSGEVKGYEIFNLRTAYQFGKGLEIFARVNNLLDKKYFTSGALAENPFTAGGTFQTNSDDWSKETFFAPGAPRGIWVGLRYEFDPARK